MKEENVKSEWISKRVSNFKKRKEKKKEGDIENDILDL